MRLPTPRIGRATFVKQSDSPIVSRSYFAIQAGFSLKLVRAIHSLHSHARKVDRPPTHSNHFPILAKRPVRFIALFKRLGKSGRAESMSILRSFIHSSPSAVSLCQPILSSTSISGFIRIKLRPLPYQCQPTRLLRVRAATSFSIVAFGSQPR